MSDSQFLIGKIIAGTGEPDAIHIAIMPVVSSETLSPGQHIGLIDKQNVSVRAVKYHGIVDPFLTKDVIPGQNFYMFLYPNTITGLRHVWTHPDIDSNPTALDKSESEIWLRNFAAEVDADYDEMMYVAASHCHGDGWGNYLSEGGKWEGQNTPDEFWTHYAVVTGKTPKNGPTGIFSCSC